MHVQIQEGRFLYYVFYPLYFFSDSLTNSADSNYLNRKPPGPGRPPCLCSWRATLLLTERFFPPQPKGSSCTMSVGHCRATWDSLPPQVWTRRLVRGSRAPGKAVPLPAAPSFLPVPNLGKDFRGDRLRMQTQRAESRESFQEPLCRPP